MSTQTGPSPPLRYPTNLIEHARGEPACPPEETRVGEAARIPPWPRKERCRAPPTPHRTGKSWDSMGYHGWSRNLVGISLTRLVFLWVRVRRRDIAAALIRRPFELADQAEAVTTNETNGGGIAGCAVVARQSGKSASLMRNRGLASAFMLDRPSSVMLGLAAVLFAAGAGALAASDSAERPFARLGPPDAPVKLYTVERGEGAPVLLIHGFGTNSFTWRHVAPDLARDHKVIAVDLKGFGRSDKPFDERYAASDQAELLTQLILDRDLHNLTIVGHSHGGGIALLLALEA